MDALLEVIDEDLHMAGLSTSQGRLAWLNPDPVTIRLITYFANDWIPLDDETIYTDFALRSNVTWDSTSGLATCGFWFRGELSDRDAEHYNFEALRLSGLPAWWVTYWNYNVEQSILTRYARTSPAINLESKSTNEYLFVAEDNLLSIYVNGESLGHVTINRLREGILAFYGFQESGDTTCTFSNTWIWDLSE